MIARLIKKDTGNYICSNCRMWQHSLEDRCVFCGASFSNFENVIVELYNDLHNNEI